jgi:hypothetical protein
MSLTSGTPVREAINRPGELCSLQLSVNLNRWLTVLTNAAPYRIFLRVSDIAHTDPARRLDGNGANWTPPIIRCSNANC